MDRELTTYLDRRFTESEKTTRRIVEEATQRIVEQTTQRIVEEATRGLATRKELDEKFRQTQVLIEDLRGGLERVSEGVVGMNAKMDRQREESEEARREDRAFLTSLFRDVKGRVDDHEVRITRLESARA